MSTLIHLIGATCAGKSTLIRAMLDFQNVAAVQIGKTLRAKYGEDYFKGQAAPAHTADEALAIYFEEVQKAIDEGFSLILIDGQPRDISQTEASLSSWPDHKVHFVLIHAAQDVREARAEAGRKPGPDLHLALARMEGDYANSYKVLVELLREGVTPTLIDTGSPHFDLAECCEFFLSV